MRSEDSSSVLPRARLEGNYYVQKGSGPYLFVHGGGPGCDPALYGDWAGLANHFSLICIQPRGCGLRTKQPPQEKFSLKDYCRDVEEIRLDLGIDTINFLGHSHGSFVGLQYAITYPSRISNLILAHSAANYEDYRGGSDEDFESCRDKPWFKAAFSAVQRQNHMVLSGIPFTSDDLTRNMLLAMPFYFREWGDKEKEKFNAEWFGTMHMEPFKYHIENEYNGSFNWSDEMHKITARTLVMTGRYDIFTSVQASETICQSISKATLHVFNDSAHMSMLEEPKAFYNTVCEFLK